ncbi:MAG: WD40 repeat domain-containing serine/threonine-protein kinase [Prosthecobacter sp.]|nr:WD40 repeat domain-containing serine/threonine-protein kinase [Prosthecobacter sp.]
MAVPDDQNTVLSSDFPDDMATIRVTQPAPSAVTDELQTLIVAKPAASQTQAALEAAPATSANPDAEEPFIFGRRIAQGGMGAILEASDCKLGRTIAVKVMLDANASAEQAQRFVQEAAVLGRLEHPNIVPIHDLGRDSEGQLFYTMKLVKGRTLQHILDKLCREDPEALKHYTLDRLLTIFRKVCDALAFAHAQMIIHRDLKPENIMVGEFGEVLVMDWGIAKLLRSNDECEITNARDNPAHPSFTTSHDTAVRTLDGAVMGTPNYMSPEQAMGQVNELDERSDIFSLGGILYAILTLRPPVEGKDVWEVLEKVSSGSITPPAAFGTTTGTRKPTVKGEVLEAKKITPLPHMPVGRVPPALSAVVMKALTLDKTQRYQDVAAFSADVEAYQGGFATSAENAGLAKQLVLLIKRHRGAFSTAAAAWLLITTLAVWFVLNLRAKEQRAVAGESSAMQKAEETRRALAGAQIALAESAYREHDSAKMQAALHTVPGDLRDTNWSYLLEHADNSLGIILNGTSSESSDAAAHPKMPGVFATVRNDGHVALVEAGTGAQLLNFHASFSAGKTSDCRLAISPDGKRLVIGRGGDRGLVVHHTDDGKKLAEWEATPTTTLQFSADGKHVLHFSRGANRITVLDAETGRPRWAVKFAGDSSQTRAVFTPDGLTVLAFSNQERFQQFAALDGAVLPAFAFLPASYGLAISPDGKRLLTSEEGEVKCRESQDVKRLLYQFQPESKRLHDMAFTADSQRILTLVNLPGGRQSLKVWDARNGFLLQSLMAGNGAGHRLAVHPLSSELLVAGKTTRAWRLPAPQEKWRFDEISANLDGAFWGGEDLLLHHRRGLGAGLVDLHLPDPRNHPLWQPEAVAAHDVTVSADGRWAVLAERTPRPPRPVKLLRLNGRVVEVVSAFDVPQTLYQMQLSPDGHLLYAEQKLLAAATGKELIRLDLPHVFGTNAAIWLSRTHILTALTTTHSRGVAGSKEQLVLWNAPNGQRLQMVDCSTPVICMAARPDAPWFVEAGAGNMIRLRDAATLEVRREFRAHDAPITALALHPTKPILASASDDRTVKLWDLDSGRCLEEYNGPVGRANRLDISRSGKRLACWSDKLTRVWEPAAFREADVAAAAVTDGWEDILARFTPANFAPISNGWLLHRGVLLSPGTTAAGLPLVPELAGKSYQVRVKLRWLSSESGLSLGLPVGEHMVTFALDAWPEGDQCWTALSLINGKTGKESPGAVPGRQVRDTAEHVLEVSVSLAGSNCTITALLDGKPLYEWSGPHANLSRLSVWTTPPGTLSLGTLSGNWSVSEVKMRRLEK